MVSGYAALDRPLAYADGFPSLWAYYIGFSCNKKSENSESNSNKRAQRLSIRREHVLRGLCHCNLSFHTSTVYTGNSLTGDKHRLCVPHRRLLAQGGS